MIETPQSSMFAGYEYDSVAWILTLKFKNGKVFEYVDFSPEDYDAFCEAKSLGTHYNSAIKGKHESRDVTGAPDAPPVKEQLKAAVAEENLGITDDDIRRVDPNYKPAAEPEVIQTPQERAIAVIAPKNPKADELTQRAHALAATVFTVTDKASQAAMEEHLVQLATIRKALFEIVDPYREIAYRAYEQIQQLNKSRLEPIDNALTTKKTTLKGYLQAEQAKAQAEQRRRDEEERKRQEEEQRQRTERLRLEVAEDQAAAGDAAGAEVSLFDQSIQAPPMPSASYTPRVEQPTSALGKIRDNWKVEVVDLEEVILDVAKGIEAMRKLGNLQGHAPTSILTTNPSALKNLGNANKALFRYPGMRCWNDGSVAVRTAKE